MFATAWLALTGSSRSSAAGLDRNVNMSYEGYLVAGVKGVLIKAKGNMDGIKKITESVCMRMNVNR